MIDYTKMELLPLEVVEIVSKFLPYIDDVVHLKCTCKHFKTNLSLHPGAEESDLELFVRVHSVELDYDKLIINSFSPRFISRNMDKKWNERRLSSYSRLTDDIVRNNPDFPWNYRIVWSNPSISFDYALKLYRQHNKSKIGFFHPSITNDFILSSPQELLNWRELTAKVDIDFIFDHVELPWHFSELTRNPTLTLNHIKMHPELQTKLKLTNNVDIINHFIITDFTKVIENKLFISHAYMINPKLLLTLSLGKLHKIKLNKIALLNKEFFIQNINNSIWDFKIISTQINSENFHIVVDNLDKNWDWRLISYQVSWNIIKSHPNYPWIPDLVSANRSVTLQVIEDNPQYQWSFKGLSFNPNIIFDYVDNHKNDFLPYMKYLSINPGITLSDINKHPKYSWLWPYVSLRPCITLIHTLKYRRIKWIMKYVCKTAKLLRYRIMISKHLLREEEN